MKNKIISISIILIFLFITLISVDAAAPSPRVDLNDYEILTADKNDIYISGIVSIGAGQNVALFDSTGKIPLNYTTVKDSNTKESFKIWVPATFLKDGTNTFKVISLPVRGRLNASNPKTVTITVKNKSDKKNQIITANNLTLKVNEKKNLNAKISTNLPLTYVSKNPNIATVDSNGIVYGKKVGSTTIDISQAGNSQFNPAKKTITVTVKQAEIVKKTQTISTNFDTWQFYDTGSDYKLTLTAKASSKLKVTWKSSDSKIASIDSKGVITPKKPGTAKIIITQKGNANYKPATKTVIVRIPKKRSRKAALKPWYDAMKTQREYSWNSQYEWYPNDGPRISTSKYYGTCITYPAVSLMRLNLIKEGYYITASTDHNGSNKSSCIARSKSAVRSVNSKYFSLYEVNDTTKNLVKKGKILPGDILGLKWHDCVYSDKSNNGTLLYNHAGRIYGSNSNRAAWNSPSSDNDEGPVWLIVRINTFNVKTACKNGTITYSNIYMAGQSAKVTYTPNKGKKIKSIRVDGKNLSSAQIKKYKNSYTFNKIDKHHYIYVVFN